MMIWLDSSYIIARLLGEPRAAFIVTLEALPIHQTTFAKSVAASCLYLDARSVRSKASLYDALLAAAVHAKNDRLLTFDEDFSVLGLE